MTANERTTGRPDEMILVAGRSATSGTRLGPQGLGPVSVPGRGAWLRLGPGDGRGETGAAAGGGMRMAAQHGGDVAGQSALVASNSLDAGRGEHLAEHRGGGGVGRGLLPADQRDEHEPHAGDADDAEGEGEQEADVAAGAEQ